MQEQGHISLRNLATENNNEVYKMKNNDETPYSYFGNSKFEKLTDDSLPNRITVDSIISDIEGFRVLFREEYCSDATRIRLSFEDFEYIGISYDMPDKSLDLFDTPNWPFYVGSGTLLIKRYHNETHGINENYSLKHYVIVGVNDETIEVLSYSDPEFTHLPKSIE